jgi:hypothetical protein
VKDGYVSRKVIIPDEFNEFCRHFHQDVTRIYSTPEPMIAAALSSMNEQQKNVVRQFLDELLSGRHTSAEIKGVWRRTPADIYFTKAKGVLAFLQLVRDVMSNQRI